MRTAQCAFLVAFLPDDEKGIDASRYKWPPIPHQLNRNQFQIELQKTCLHHDPQIDFCLISSLLSFFKRIAFYTVIHLVESADPYLFVPLLHFWVFPLSLSWYYFKLVNLRHRHTKLYHQLHFALPKASVASIYI